jgi:hypothetical protein
VVYSAAARRKSDLEVICHTKWQESPKTRAPESCKLHELYIERHSSGTAGRVV